MAKAAYGTDECGTEACIALDGRTLDEVREIYPEYNLTHTGELRDQAYYYEQYAANWDNEPTWSEYD